MTFPNRYAAVLSLLVVCSLSAKAQDSQPLRTFYGNPNPAGQGTSTPISIPPIAPYSGSPYNAAQAAPYNGNPYNGAPNGQYSGAPGYHPNTYVPPMATQHAPGTMPNPAYMPMEDNRDGHLQKQEYQRLEETLRQRGYSEERIWQTVGQYHQEPPPGTKYKMMGGIKVIDDGLTPQQHLHNITHSGLFDTPISTDPHYYQPGTYGYYKTHGGTKGYGQWLDDGQR